MNKLKLIILVVFFINPFSIQAFDLSNIKKLKWNDLEVIWLVDERYPTYVVSFYFADGSLSDSKNKFETVAMFNLLTSGTTLYSQKDISDNLEFYGVSPSINVSHEYSTYSYSGLVKDIIPVTKKICHIFAKARFPKKEISKSKKIYINQLKNMVNNHGGLSRRIYKQLIYRGTPYRHPIDGTIVNISRVKQRSLIRKLKYFNENVKKRIYIAGPRKTHKIKNILLNECGWMGKGKFSRVVKYTKKPKKTSIYLVTVPKANQAQIRVGRFLNHNQCGNVPVKRLLDKYLGGGFTSLLIKELRIKRGLTYGAGSGVLCNKKYGMSVIATFTKNSSVNEIILVLKDIFKNISTGQIDKQTFGHSRKGLAGSFPFLFETKNHFLYYIIDLDHKAMSYEHINDFVSSVNVIRPKHLVNEFNNAFDWDRQVILVLGNKILLKPLKKLGYPVKVIDYKKFL